MLRVPLLRLDPGLDPPRYATPGDAGVDLRSSGDHRIEPGGHRTIVPTGVAIALPPTHAGLILPRSGLARRHGVTIVNSPGLIDSGYRGELEVLLMNTDPTVPFSVRRGDRIAQLVVIAAEQVALTAVDSLPASERGTRGWGHSGRS